MKMRSYVRFSLAIVSLITALSLVLTTGPLVLANDVQSNVSVHKEAQVQDYFLKLTGEQASLRNQKLNENPGINEADLLRLVTPNDFSNLPSDFIKYLQQTKASPYNPDEPVIYLYSIYGPFPKDQGGKRTISFDTNRNPIYGPLTLTETKVPGTLRSDFDSVYAQRIYQGYFPYIGLHDYASIATYGNWEWDDTQVLSVWGTGYNAWSDTTNYCRIDSSWIDSVTYGLPASSWEWWAYGYYYMQGPGEEPHHHFNMYSDITVQGDGWWRAAYGYSGNGPGLWHQFNDNPTAGWYQK